MSESPPRHQAFISLPLVKFDGMDKMANIPINDILQREDTKLKNVLEHPYVFKAFLDTNTHLIRFLQDHINEFIDLVLSKDDLEHSSVAYILAKLNNITIISAISSSPAFYKAAMNIISQNEIDSLLLNRLVLIVYLIIFDNEKCFPPNCGFILQLFQAIDNYCVVSFFDSILQDNPIFFHVQEWLSKVEFHCIVCEELDALDPAGDPYNDIQTRKYLSLLSIVRVCAKSASLKEKFHSPSIIASVTRPLNENCSHFALQEQWVTMNSIYDESTADMMRGFFHHATKAILDSSDKKGKIKTEAICFITKMLRYDKIIHEFFNDFGLDKVLINILYEHYSETFLIKATIELAEEAMKNKELARSFINGIIPPLLYEAKQDNLFLREIAFEIIDWCERFSREEEWFSVLINSVNNYTKFVACQLKDWRKITEPIKV